MCGDEKTNKVWFPCFHNSCRTCFDSLKKKNGLKKRNGFNIDMWVCHICHLKFSLNSIRIYDNSCLNGDIWYSGLKEATVSQLLYTINCAFPRSGYEKNWINELTDEEDKILHPYGLALYRSGDTIQYGTKLCVHDVITKYTIRTDYCITLSYEWKLKPDYLINSINSINLISTDKLFKSFESLRGKRIICYDCNDSKIIIQSKHNFPLLVLWYIPNETIYQLKLRILYYWYLDYTPACLQLNTETIEKDATIIAWIGSE
jgi:hypothetical protein